MSGGGKTEDTNPPNVADSKPKSPFVIIFLSEPIELDADKISQSFSARHAGTNHEALGNQGNLWKVGPLLFAVMNMGVPCPPGWQSFARRAKTFWPEAETVCRQHRSHINVTAMGDELDRLQIARYTTALTDAIADAHPEAIAILWDSAVVQPRATWQKQGGQALGLGIPFPLWVGIHSFRDEDRNGGFVTFGLYQFVGRELEVAGPADDIPAALNATAGLTEYILKGAKIEDGHTIGDSITERIPVYHRKSVMFGGMPVFAINLPGAKPAGRINYPLISRQVADTNPVLQAFASVGLFAVSDESNQVALPFHYAHDERLESLDEGFINWIAPMEQDSGYKENEAKAKAALGSGDREKARAILEPYAAPVRNLQEAMRAALLKGEMWMFMPKLPPAFS